MPRALTEAQIETIRVLRRQGYKSAYIAYKLKISIRTVTNHVGGVRRGRAWTPEEKELAVKLRNQGLSYRKIGLQLGRTYSAVSQMFYYYKLLDLLKG